MYFFSNVSKTIRLLFDVDVFKNTIQKCLCILIVYKNKVYALLGLMQKSFISNFATTVC